MAGERELGNTPSGSSDAGRYHGKVSKGSSHHLFPISPRDFPGDPSDPSVHAAHGPKRPLGPSPRSIILIRLFGRYTVEARIGKVPARPATNRGPRPHGSPAHARPRPARIMRTPCVPPMPAIVAYPFDDSTPTRNRGGSGRMSCS